MLGMIATLGLAGMPENGFSDTILQDGTAKFISTADYDACISGLSVSAWVEFIPEPGHGKLSKSVGEVSQDTPIFDPICLLDESCCNQIKTGMETPRHGHSFILAVAIQSMNPCYSETSSEADVQDVHCEIEDTECTKQPCGKEKGSGSKTSTHDTLPTMCGDSQGRTDTMESFDSSDYDASEDNQYSTKDTLPSLSGLGDEEGGC